MNHSIIPAMPGDLDLLLELMGEYYAHDGLAFKPERAGAALLELLGNDRYGRVWLLTTADTLAGYIVLTFGYSLEFHGRDAFVDEFYLRPQFRRQGLGSAALAFAAAYCERNRICSLHLAVERDNHDARAFYPTQGFVSRGQTLYTRLTTSRSAG
ncbi:MAG: GNAT family N-acetyltransferase [Nevskia sp.]|nr:GNAT family N-acetyltransferase [Nevskia sp.]